MKRSKAKRVMRTTVDREKRDATRCTGLVLTFMVGKDGIVTGMRAPRGMGVCRRKRLTVVNHTTCEGSRSDCRSDERTTGGIQARVGGRECVLVSLNGR